MRLEIPSHTVPEMEREMKQAFAIMSQIINHKEQPFNPQLVLMMNIMIVNLHHFIQVKHLD